MLNSVITYCDSFSELNSDIISVNYEDLNNDLFLHFDQSSM